MKENSSHYAVFRRLLQAGSLAALLGLPVFVMAQSQGAGDEESLVDAFVQSMQEASGGTATIERSPQTGLAIVAALPDGVAVRGGDTSSERAFVFLDQYGEAFGITDPQDAGHRD